MSEHQGPPDEVREQMLALLEEHGLPEPDIVHRNDDGEVELIWLEQKLVVQVTG